MEGDLPVASFLLLFGYFNPLPPHGGRLKGEYSFFAFPKISIHSLRMEGDTFVRKLSRSHFNPLPPHGGRPVLTSILRSNPAFQSTPSAWRETSFSIKLSSDLIFQSTPSAWRETARQQIHAFLAVQFQSTPSAWRETWPPHMCRVVLPYFNPLPPHGGRLRLFQR